MEKIKKMAIAIMVLVTVFMLNVGSVQASEKCTFDRSSAFCKVDLDDTLPEKTLACKNDTGSRVEMTAGPNCPMDYYLFPGEYEKEPVYCETIPGDYDIVSAYGILTPGVVKCTYFQLPVY